MGAVSGAGHAVCPGRVHSCRQTAPEAQWRGDCCVERRAVCWPCFISFPFLSSRPRGVRVLSCPVFELDNEPLRTSDSRAGCIGGQDPGRHLPLALHFGSVAVRIPGSEPGKELRPELTASLTLTRPTKHGDIYKMKEKKKGGKKEM